MEHYNFTCSHIGVAINLKRIGREKLEESKHSLVPQLPAMAQDQPSKTIMNSNMSVVGLREDKEEYNQSKNMKIHNLLMSPKIEKPSCLGEMRGRRSGKVMLKC